MGLVRRLLPALPLLAARVELLVDVTLGRVAALLVDQLFAALCFGLVLAHVHLPNWVPKAPPLGRAPVVGMTRRPEVLFPRGFTWETSVTLSPWSRLSTPGSARSAACGSPSRTSATSAAATACRLMVWSGSSATSC